jgi:hypothetical protein
MCRQGQLNALVLDGHFQSPDMRALTNLLSPTSMPLMDTNFQTVTTQEIAELRKKSQEVSDTDYNILFQYLYQHTGLPWRHFSDTPHPPKSLVLPMTLTTLTHFQHQGHKYSTLLAHSGNSAIQFYDSSHRDYYAHLADSDQTSSPISTPHFYFGCSRSTFA